MHSPVERRTEDVRFFVDEEIFRVTRAEVEERGEWRLLILNFALEEIISRLMGEFTLSCLPASRCN